MKYTIKNLAELAGVSSRTLRYYDQIDLLKPDSINPSGYRVYDQNEVDLLQQILFYRELGLDLATIRQIVHSPSFDKLEALQGHLTALEGRKNELDLLIGTLKKTILMEEGKVVMKDYEKFEGFKKQKLQENEEKYGKEIRDRYGEKCAEESNAKWMGLTQAQSEQMQKLAEKIQSALEQAVESGQDPADEAGTAIAQMHKEWLSFTWPEYSKEAHAGVGRMYTDDARFTAYYDSRISGCAQFLRDAILAFVCL